MKNSIQSTLKETANILDAFISDDNNIQKIASAVEIMATSLKNGRKMQDCHHSDYLK